MPPRLDAKQADIKRAAEGKKGTHENLSTRSYRNTYMGVREEHRPDRPDVRRVSCDKLYGGNYNASY